MWCECSVNTADCVNPYLTAETQRISSSQQHPHLRKVSVSESNVLLDEEVLTDPKIQALLLTVLVKFLTFCGGWVFCPQVFIAVYSWEALKY